MPCRLRLFLTGGQVLHLEQQDYAGFSTRPFSWEQAEAKFERLAAPYAERQLLQAIVEAVAHLETIDVSQLAERLARVNRRTVA
jgi:2-methylcitrate dehydratase